MATSYPRTPCVPHAAVRVIRLCCRPPAGTDHGDVENETRSHRLLMEKSPGGPEAPYVARIAGAGRCLPSTHLTTEELMASTRHRTGIDLERLTGIHERRVATGDEDSLSLAVAAAEDCLATSGRRAEDVEVLISCSITKYRDGLVQWMEPATATAVAGAIGARQALTFDVSNACAGMLTGVLILDD